MKKVVMLLVCSIFLLGFIIAIEEPTTNPEQENLSVWKIVINLLKDLLNIQEKSFSVLEDIRDKDPVINVSVEPNITIEPPEVIVEEVNNMPKRGNIFFPYGNRIVGRSDFGFVLPNGICTIKLITDCAQMDLCLGGDCSGCAFGCTKTVEITENNYYLKGDTNCQFNYVDVAYNCV